jgi:hypothetical protein
MYPGRDQYYAGRIPLRFKIEIADEQDLTSFRIIAISRNPISPIPQQHHAVCSARTARPTIRITANRLRPVKVSPCGSGAEPVDGPDYSLTVAKIGWFPGGAMSPWM